jgi:hypothetical protein
MIGAAIRLRSAAWSRPSQSIGRSIIPTSREICVSSLTRARALGIVSALTTRIEESAAKSAQRFQ